MTDAEKDEYIRALGERELECRFATLERERQEFLAKLSPRRRTTAIRCEGRRYLSLIHI